MGEIKTKEQWKEEMMDRCEALREEFPQHTAFYVYAMMICCAFDKDKARDAIRNNKPLKPYV